MAEILREAGVNSGSLYHHFDSKEDLLVAVLARYESLLGPAVMSPAARATDDPVERVFTVLGGYRRLLLESDFELGCPIGNLALETSETGSPTVRAGIEANFAAWRSAIRDFLEPALDRFPSGTDLDEVAEFVLTVMEGGVMQARTRRGIEPFDASVEQLRRWFDRMTTTRRKEDR